MSRPRFFFVHVMKTGGTSFLRYARECLGPGQIWYGVDDSFVNRFEELISGENPLEAAASNFLDVFFKAEPEVFRYMPQQGACFFEGHMPFVARHALQCNGRMPECLSILRHPVERVVSHLTQDARRSGMDRHGPERLHNDPYWFSAYGRNYQTRLFSMTREETFVGKNCPVGWLDWMKMVVLVACGATPAHRHRVLQQLLEKGKDYVNQGESALLEADTRDLVGRIFPNMAPVTIDKSRFDAACTALEACAVIGVSDQMAQMARDMYWRFGWSGKIRVSNQSPPGMAVPATVRKQIARNNEADIELYEYARKLVRKQQRARLRRYSLPW